MALCSNAAATLESTPPLRPRITFPSPPGADFLDGPFHVIPHRPVFATTTNAVDKIGDDFPAARRVDDFGMKLQAEKFPRAVFNGGVFGVFGDGDRFEIARQFRELVAVRIPDLQDCGRLRTAGKTRPLRATCLCRIRVLGLSRPCRRETARTIARRSRCRAWARRARKYSCPPAAHFLHTRWTDRRTK